MRRRGLVRGRRRPRSLLTLLLLAGMAGFLLLRWGLPGSGITGQGASRPDFRPGSTRPPVSLTTGKWPARLKHVIDGDSFFVETLEGCEMEIRLVGINAPEMSVAQGSAARSVAAGLLETATSIVVEPEPSGAVDKYGRILAWVWLELPSRPPGHPVLMNEEMLRRAGVPLFKNASPRMKYFQRLVAASGEAAVNY